MHSPSVLPESAQPDSSRPESSVPESSVPDSSVPESSVPDSSVPDYSVPDSSRPGTAQPGPDTGWGIVLRHDLEAPSPEVWRRLLADWLPLWLGVDSVPQMVGAPLRRGRSGRGRVVGCHMGRRVRVRWVPPGLAEETIAQVTLEERADGARGGTTLVLQQDPIRGLAAQQGLLAHWQAAISQLPR